MTVPATPRIYHITHVDNLAAIVTEDALLSHSAMNARGGPRAAIGMETIKRRRLSRPVPCHPGTSVGDYVPFYFCPRSVMLFLLHKGNHPELDYKEGQVPILHLEADLRAAVAWAEAQGRPWAFTLANAAAAYTEFRNRLDQLDEVDWAAVAATDWREAAIKDAKQAEFLLHGSFPWQLVTRIGAQSAAIRDRAARVLTEAAGAVHRPPVDVRPAWYY